MKYYCYNVCYCELIKWVTVEFCCSRDDLVDLRPKAKNSPVNKCVQPKPVVNLTATPANTATPPPLVIFNRMGVNILQPNQGVNILQPNQSVGILQPNQSVGILQPNQVGILQNNPVGLVRPVQPTQSTVTMGVVHPSQTSAIVSVRQPQSKNIVVVTSSNNTNPTNTGPIQIDLSRVKKDPDAQMSPARTEFVDMDMPVKTEPMEEDELELLENFDFLPEDSSQDSVQGNGQSNIELDQPKDQSSKSLTASPTRSTPPAQVSDSVVDSNQLFMQSIVAHMKQMSPYDQSMFKMRVQQLLHDMMFPQKLST